MTAARAGLIAAAALVCAESSDPMPAADLRVLPDAVEDIVEQTGCPEAADIAPEECLLWLTQPQAQDPPATETIIGAEPALPSGAEIGSEPLPDSER